ncbi:signal peptidase I [bacterium DOLZORAL124_38_8]|nr:MAG: signal peptidase I [bacterium DOLZORAL124_38_8]
MGNKKNLFFFENSSEFFGTNCVKMKNWIKDEDQSWASFWLEIVFLGLLIVFVRLYVFQLFQVSGPSMCPTLNMFDSVCQQPYGKESKSDFIFVNEFLYSIVSEPKKGEIVVFNSPNKSSNKWLELINKVIPFWDINTKTPTRYIKRVIGTAGDTVTVKQGKVFLQAKDTNAVIELPEPYLNKTNKGSTTSQKETFVVPEGKILVFGDNRVNSTDARMCFGSCRNGASPFTDVKDVVGRAEFIIFPINHIRFLNNSLGLDD